MCSHAHTNVFPHTHTTHISKLEEIEISHTLAKWGSGSRKKKRTNSLWFRIDFSAGVDNRDLNNKQSTDQNPKTQNLYNSTKMNCEAGNLEAQMQMDVAFPL